MTFACAPFGQASDKRLAQFLQLPTLRKMARGKLTDA
jgi:hypothetical protein